jgi:pimeloyl-ACP methyl ester carboxylesterase
MAYADVNGLHMYYEEHGDGPPLLLLHGGGGSAEYFSDAIPFFGSRFRVVAAEVMGHGRTGDDVARPFHYHDLAEDVIELMRVLRIERASILGYSDGGIVGLDMAIHHPERVTKLAVTGANSRVDGYTEETQEEGRSFDPAAEPVSEAYARLSPDGAGHWPMFLARLKLMWMVEPDFTLEQLQSIAAPTLLVVGDADVVTPEHAVEMFRAIPGAQLCIVPNAGHGVLPRETILTFLQYDGSGET